MLDFLFKILRNFSNLIIQRVLSLRPKQIAQTMRFVVSREFDGNPKLSLMTSTYTKLKFSTKLKFLTGYLFRLAFIRPR